MNYPSAAIVGCLDIKLNDWEKKFFRDLDPYGFILFKRNCDNAEQIRQLCNELRECVGRAEAPILIDQEGGRVARLSAPEFPRFPAIKIFGDLALSDLAKAKENLTENTRAICKLLLSLGVNVDCIPVLDVLDEKGHNIIGDRAFGSDPELVKILGHAVIETCLREGVIPIAKHVPGHGRAMADSHEELPVVNVSLKELKSRDFVPFHDLDPRCWAMLAHVVYTALDAENPASISPAVIAMIREEFKFNGVLIGDDVSMKALTGSYKERAERTLAAGADLALHCNGDQAEMLELAQGLRPLTEISWQRLHNV